MAAVWDNRDVEAVKLNEGEEYVISNLRGRDAQLQRVIEQNSEVLDAVRAVNQEAAVALENVIAFGYYYYDMPTARAPRDMYLKLLRSVSTVASFLTKSVEGLDQTTINLIMNSLGMAKASIIGDREHIDLVIEGIDGALNTVTNTEERL